MKAQGFCRSAPRFFQSSTSRNAPRKIWEAHAKIRFTILMQICDVIHQSPQPNACLLFDASQRANRYTSNRMWHSDPSWLHRMLELLVAPNMRNLIPAVLLQALYDFSARHKTRYTLSTHLSSRDLQNLSSYPRPRPRTRTLHLSRRTPGRTRHLNLISTCNRSCRRVQTVPEFPVIN